MKKLAFIIALFIIFIYAGQNMMGMFIDEISLVSFVDKILNPTEGN